MRQRHPSQGKYMLRRATRSFAESIGRAHGEYQRQWITILILSQKTR
jgi:hypothetical protein